MTLSLTIYVNTTQHHLHNCRYFDLVREYQALQATCQRSIIQDQAATDNSPAPEETGSPTCAVENDKISELERTVKTCEKKIETRDEKESGCSQELQACRQASHEIDQIREIHQVSGTLSDEAALSQNLSVINAHLVTKEAVCLENLELEIKRSSQLEEVAFEQELRANESEHQRQATQDALSKSVAREGYCQSKVDKCTTEKATCVTLNSHIQSNLDTCAEEGKACRLTLALLDSKNSAQISDNKILQGKLDRCETKNEACTLHNDKVLNLKDEFSNLKERYKLLEVSCDKDGLTDVHLSNSQLAGQALIANPGLLTIFILMILGDAGFLLITCMATIRYCRRPLEPRRPSKESIPLQDQPSAPPAKPETA